MNKFFNNNKPPKPIQGAGYRYHVPTPAVLTGWKFYGVIGGMVSFVALMMYPILVDPVLHADKYKRIHEEVQTELFQAGLLPGQLKKWEDPMKRFKE